MIHNIIQKCYYQRFINNVQHMTLHMLLLRAKVARRMLYNIYNSVDLVVSPPLSLDVGYVSLLHILLVRGPAWTRWDWWGVWGGK